jgi:hypothetical protein
MLIYAVVVEDYDTENTPVLFTDKIQAEEYTDYFNEFGYSFKVVEVQTKDEEK